MPDGTGSLTRRAVAAAASIFILASGAWAQQPAANAPTAQFLPRYDFHLSAAAVDSGDERFSWDTHFGGEFDLVDYGRGRATFAGDYQAVLGSEFRAFDPNQGNYTLAAGSSVRLGGIELAGVLHHVSRHLSDRPKRLAIAWNDLDAVVLKRFSVEGTTIDVRAGGGPIIAHAYVDYSWTADANVLVRHAVGRRVGFYGRASGETRGIDSALSTRGQQNGGRFEAGVRFSGEGGAVELFGGWERMIDADPYERLPRQWTFAGFRLASK